jgi:hypothetical protein
MLLSLFTSVPVDALKVIRNRLQDNHTLAEWSTLQVEDIKELLEVCLRTTCCQVDDKFFQQKDGMAMGSSLSPVICNIYMEYYENRPWTWYSTNHHCGFDMWMIYFDLATWSR